MNVKTTIVGVLAAAASLAAASPAKAEPDALGAWARTVGKKLDLNIRRLPDTGGHGVAYATIRRTADGRAELVRMDCEKRGVARATRIAIARLRRLPPMPAGFEKTPVRVQVLLGNPDDVYGYYAELKRMRARADQNNRMVAARVAGAQLAMAEAR